MSSTLKRRTPLRRKSPMRSKTRLENCVVHRWTRQTPLVKVTPKPRKKMKQIGKKGREWINARNRLKRAFQRAGITTCEYVALGCWRDNGLGFAHSEKRRNITSGEQLVEVILACNHCHDIIESLSHEEMRSTVKSIIGLRKTRVEVK